jgi:hypothetical protein
LMVLIAHECVGSQGHLLLCYIVSISTPGMVECVSIFTPGIVECLIVFTPGIVECHLQWLESSLS